MGRNTDDLTLEEKIRTILAFGTEDGRVRALRDLVADAVDEAVAGTAADPHPLARVRVHTSGHQCGKSARLEAALRDHPNFLADLRVEVAPSFLHAQLDKQRVPSAIVPITPAPADEIEQRITVAPTPWRRRLGSWLDRQREARLYRRMTRELERKRLEPVDLTYWRTHRPEK